MNTTILAGQIADVFTNNGPKLGILGGLTDLFGMFWSMILGLTLLGSMLSIGWIAARLGYSSLSKSGNYTLAKAITDVKAPAVAVVIVITIVGIVTAFIGKY